MKCIKFYCGNKDGITQAHDALFILRARQNTMFVIEAKDDYSLSVVIKVVVLTLQMTSLPSWLVL